MRIVNLVFSFFCYHKFQFKLSISRRFKLIDNIQSSSDFIFLDSTRDLLLYIVRASKFSRYTNSSRTCQLNGNSLSLRDWVSCFDIICYRHFFNSVLSFVPELFSSITILVKLFLCIQSKYNYILSQKLLHSILTNQYCSKSKLERRVIHSISDSYIIYFTD